MTLAEYRRRQASAGHDTPGAMPAALHREQAHPTPAEYARIGLALSGITAIEVALYYIDMATAALVAMLIVLSGMKFSLVVAWFMHLRFDNRLFSALMVGGLALAFSLFIVVLSTLGAGLT
ncbi:MAG TPA: cytochrome C oxidase subunit IV family protein [Dehalococcoidia bacterium]|nr:cytochrome C oxidase subunit IV family protein [Dehalococcoidia bacterium]